MSRLISPTSERVKPRAPSDRGTRCRCVIKGPPGRQPADCTHHVTHNGWRRGKPADEGRGLRDALAKPEGRSQAADPFRGCFDKNVIPPGDGLLQVVGNVGSMLAAAQGRPSGTKAVGIVGCGARNCRSLPSGGSPHECGRAQRYRPASPRRLSREDCEGCQNLERDYLRLAYLLTNYLHRR